MNFSILNVALFGAGALLIASAIKGKSPQQIIAESVGSATGKTGKGSKVPPRTPNGPYTTVDGPYPSPDDPSIAGMVTTSP